MKENNIGILIRSLRVSYGLSQYELGKELGFAARTVSDWENGNTKPSISTVKAIVKFFNITYDTFFKKI